MRLTPVDGHHTIFIFSNVQGSLDMLFNGYQGRSLRDAAVAVIHSRSLGGLLSDFQ